MTARRGLPRGARAQLILLLLVALALAQLGGIAALLDERARAVRFAAAKEAASRLVNVARELDSTPAATVATVLRAAESHALRFSVDERPLASAPDAEPQPRLTDRIVHIVEAPPQRDLGIALRALDPQRDGRAADDRRRAAAEELLVSAALADGRWLNARFVLDFPSLQWAWPLAILAVTVALVVAVVWVSVGRIVRPMRALAAAADRLGRSDKPAPLPLSGPTELRGATAAFNAMADRLTRLLDERARMLAAVGHDLRSPITAMRIRLEMIDDDETRTRIASCLDEIQTLVEAALALARGASAEEPQAAVDLGALLDELVADLRERGARASLAVDAEVVVDARPTALKQAIRNVAENACRYGAEARIRLECTSGFARIVVDDSGPGIPVEARRQVFDPFVRLEGSRSRDTGGAGLGLAIALTVVESHGGTIAIDDADGGGTRVIITLPGARPGPAQPRYQTV
ncbi:MAG: HAMP domain-containing sensor histidine kinase [Alphaproteobacteria bacterium]